MSKRTCFVISPIGQEGSETRKHADDVFDLIIKPAVEKYGFDVIRADKIPGSGPITEDVIRLVQESSLCIIDLTGQNPNVFYECGRRHESGKSFIQIIDIKEENIAFDLAGIRTIKYDLENLRNARKAILTIQEYIDKSIKDGFLEQKSGASMSTINDAIIRIERKINAINSGAFQSSNFETSGEDSQISILSRPKEAFYRAIYKGNISAAASILPRLQEIFGPSRELAAAATMIAKTGNSLAGSILLDLLNSQNDFDTDTLRGTIVGTVNYYLAIEKPLEGYNTLKPHIENYINRDEVSKEKQASILNYLQMLLYGADKFEEALTYCEKVLELAPKNSSYRYNASLIYSQLNMKKKAVEEIEACIELGDEDTEDHLSQAMKAYKANNQMEKYNEALNKLKMKNAIRAQMSIEGLDE